MNWSIERTRSSTSTISTGEPSSRIAAALRVRHLAQPRVERPDDEVLLAAERVHDQPVVPVASLSSTTGSSSSSRRRRPARSSSCAATTSPTFCPSTVTNWRCSSDRTSAAVRAAAGRCGCAGRRTARRRSSTSTARMHRERDRQLQVERRALAGPVVMRTDPPTLRPMSCTTSSPTPRPEILGHPGAVEKPGRKRNSSSSALVMPAGHLGACQPALDDLAAEPSRSMPPPSSDTVTWQHPGAVAGLQADRAGLGLAGRGSRCRASRCRDPPRCGSGASSGASSLSRMSRSTSVWSPSTSSRPACRASRAMSRTSRGKPCMPSAKGRIRLTITSR